MLERMSESIISPALTTRGGTHILSVGEVRHRPHARMDPIAIKGPFQGPANPDNHPLQPPSTWLLSYPDVTHGCDSRTDITSLASRRASSADEFQPSSYPQIPRQAWPITNLNEPPRRSAAGTPLPVGPLVVPGGRPRRRPRRRFPRRRPVP